MADKKDVEVGGTEVIIGGNNGAIEVDKAIVMADVETTTSTSSSSTSEDVEQTTTPDQTQPNISNAPRSNPTPPPQSFCVKHCSPFRIIAIVAVISAAVAIATTLGSPQQQDPNDPDDPTATNTKREFDIFDPSTWLDPSQWKWVPRWLDHNPHGGDTPYDFNVWGTDRPCQGLELQIIDNLDPKWDSYFQESIQDWENGSPDVLTLNVRKAYRYDPECEHELKTMKVCNGDYGATDYVGINHVAIQWNYIISSIAMMNDHYLDHMSTYARQNTMCHELGHGFGLGHWDEDFRNRDLGNCMDYTDSPINNQRPDRSNFVFLEQMYGNVDGTSLYVDPSAVNGTEGLYCASTSTSKSEIFRRGLRQGSEHEEEKPTIAQEELSRYTKMFMSAWSDPDSNLRRSLETKSSKEKDHPLAHLGWRYLKRNDHEEVHEVDIGNGAKMQTHVKLMKK